ncbi:HCP-like protein [Jackrogersella minutella]|nr:HCP-like protein [Jackrogersella minutella]
MYGPPGPGGPGRGGRPPPPGVGGRGGPMGGPMRGPPFPRGGGPPGPGRGYPPGRGGRPGPPDRTMSSDPNANRHAPSITSPNEQDFGSPFPVFPGHNRRTDMDDENDIANRMGGMDINGGRPGVPPKNGPGPGPGRGPGPGPGPRRAPTMEDYGRPSMDSQRGGRGPPPQGYPDPRRVPPVDQGYGYHDDGYGPPMSPTRDGYGPPGRSMTMPANNDYMRNAMPPPPPGAPYSGGPPGRNPPHMRPSTSSSNRPPPQRMYPDQGPPGQYNNGSLQPPGWNEEPDRTSFGEFYDTYYDQRVSGEQYPPGNPPGSQVREDIPDFDAVPSHGPRGSLEQHMRPGQPGMPQPGPARQPEMSRAKSQPNLREPQAAVFEMAGDMPPVPPGGFQAYKPPGALPGLPSTPNPPRRSSQGTPQAGPGSGHPAPIRPGLMPNSMVNLNDKPAPIRNYSGGTPPAAAGAQGRTPPPPQNGRPTSVTEKAPVTPEELERLRNIIKNDPNDQESALSLAKKLVEAADVLVPKLPDPKARARSRERYVMDAHKILKKLASAQNFDAMFFLADCMGRGLLGDNDNKEAFTLYQSAAKMGHAAAAYRTAVCCELGNDEGGGTRKDPLKAIQWYKRAATLGDTPAMYKVGMIMLKGLLGQPKNPREAVGWLKRAAERADPENPHALHELGLLYESAQPNDAILRDEAYALQLFEQAAQLGYKFSQFRMGCAYEYGLMGCPIDPRLSIMWYSRAATQEEHQSELALSGWYLTGSEGVLQQSDTEAYLWARKAAQAGLAKAEYAMGYFTEVGIGVPANLEDAKRWYWRAASQDFPKARERLEDLKRSGRNGPRQRERISRSKIGKQQEGECSVM